MKFINFVTAIHGNERLPVLALASASIPQTIANPVALKQNVRFVEKDMNASFGTQGDSLEERAARRILAALPSGELVVDFHTFSGASEPFAIVVDLDMLPLAQATGLKKVVYMRHNIKSGRALINHRSGVSVECGQHTDPKSFETALSIVESTRKKKRGKVEVFEVYGRIEQPGDYQNFELFDSGKEQFYPILSGKNAYDFHGLKAKLIPSATIEKGEL